MMIKGDDATRHRYADEIPGDGIDQNCDGQELCFNDVDNEIEDNWLMLIYLEDSNPDKQTIVIEDKTSEKYITKKFNTTSIFSYSDWMVDRWTQFLDREFKKKKTN